MEAGAVGKGGEIFVLDMGKQIKILDLAKEMIKFSGLTPDEDVPIVFIGIRPGEKLFEEILTAEEGTVATQYHKIFITKLPKIDEENLKFSLKRLKSEVQQADKEGIKDVLKKITAVAKKR